MVNNVFYRHVAGLHSEQVGNGGEGGTVALTGPGPVVTESLLPSKPGEGQASEVGSGCESGMVALTGPAFKARVGAGI